MRRILLDSNAVDPFLLPGAFEAAQKTIANGTHELLFTHVNIDELAEIADLDRRQHLLLLLVALGQLIPTGAVALDYSRLDFCRLSEDADVFEAVQSGNLANTRDALLAVTAEFEGCALATNDKRLRKRALAKNVEVISSAELLRDLGYVTP